MSPLRADAANHGAKTGRRLKQPPLGPMLRNAWVGYQRRLDVAMAAAGFGDRGFPDGRVLRICRDSAETTISEIGRELGITRQGAGKIVVGLRDRGYVSIERSSTSAREKTVTLTPKAHEYLAAQRAAVRKIDNQLRRSLRPEGLRDLYRLLDLLGDHDQVRLRDYLRQQTVRDL
jgi:DNA-binding MarR family transcriptional regulator